MIHLRPRADQDLPACVRALAAVHAVDRYPMVWPADPVSWLSPPGGSAAWVVGPTPADGKPTVVLGHVCVVRETDVALVSRLFVAPAGRGQGLGASLLGAALTHAATYDLHLMLDVVDDDGPAAALYERLGWRLVERRPADWTAPDGRRPQLRVYRAPL